MKEEKLQRTPPRSTRHGVRRQRQMCIRDRHRDEKNNPKDQ